MEREFLATSGRGGGAVTAAAPPPPPPPPPAAPKRPLHVKCRGQHPQYPYKPQFVPDSRVPWAAPYPEYAPINFTHGAVISNDKSIKPGGWADPQVLTSLAAGPGRPPAPGVVLVEVLLLTFLPNASPSSPLCGR